jgi:hypothetical protein
MKQLLNAKIQPLGATLRYKSFLMIQSSYQYVFANRSDLQFHLLSSIYSLDNIHYTLGAIYTFHESISFGMLYKHLYGISGIIQYTVSAPRFDVLFSMAYQTPIQSSAQNVVPAMQLDFGLIK